MSLIRLLLKKKKKIKSQSSKTLFYFAASKWCLYLKGLVYDFESLKHKLLK